MQGFWREGNSFMNISSVFEYQHFALVGLNQSNILFVLFINNSESFIWNGLSTIFSLALYFAVLSEINDNITPPQIFVK